MHTAGRKSPVRFFTIVLWATLALDLSTALQAQNPREVRYATVSHITSKHVYVRLLSTPSSIRAGDTLWKASTPCLLVLRSSSVSCLTRPLGTCPIQVGDTVHYFIPTTRPVASTVRSQRDSLPSAKAHQSHQRQPTLSRRQRPFALSMRYSLSDDAQYSTLHSELRHMFSYRFTFTLEHPMHLPIGLDMQMYYRHPRGYASELRAFRIHHVALRYSPWPTTDIFVGRNLRHWQGDAGPIDGLAVENRYGRWTFGLTAGFHSSPFSFGFSSKGKTKGAYKNESWMDIRYRGRLDRRYFTFAHHFIPSKVWRFRLRGTIDVPAFRNGSRIDRPYFTNVQIGIQSRPWQWLRASLGAFRRTRPLYLYSYEELFDDFVERNTAVWGLYTRTNASWPFLRLALGYSRRMHRHGTVSHYSAQVALPKVPWLHGRLSYTFIESYSTYLRTRGHTVHYRQPFFRGRWSWQLYLRSLDYRFRRLAFTHRSWVVGTGWSIPLYALGTLDCLVEGTQHATYSQFRYYLRLTKRIRVH